MSTIQDWPAAKGRRPPRPVFCKKIWAQTGIEIEGKSNTLNSLIGYIAGRGTRKFRGRLEAPLRATDRNFSFLTRVIIGSLQQAAPAGVNFYLLKRRTLTYRKETSASI